MAHHARRVPGEVQVALAFAQLLERIGQQRRLAATYQLFSQYTRGVRQGVVGAWLNGVNRLAGVEVIQCSARKGFAICGIHAVGTRRKAGKTIEGAPAGAPSWHQRCARGTTSRCSTPTYSALGRMMRLLARCSNTWQHQPTTREQTKIGVNSGVGMPMKLYADAW